ncbi:pancreatic lipase-related protein 2 isoform X2 [Drosophila virilis]|uniref:pancreatic lipase-related protein 2 isoform X2 n=1 Tax=Drosophila virilis TaxID=7244 RepID=UPI00139644F3|nr:pancreatic lipase-related protein 2 isoform X2 [Drosophila virilis]
MRSKPYLGAALSSAQLRSERSSNMSGMFCCWLLFLCQVWSLHAASLDTLAQQSSIYYQHVPSELSLERVEQLTDVHSLKLIVHGFLGSRSHISIMPLRNAYQAQGFEHVLIADWSPAANLDYPSSRRAVGRVALVLAKQLEQFLERHNVSEEAVHIVGHSLGAHIAGRIGRYFNGTVGRVTGLDPALPLFTARSDDGLRASAAMFVDVIHTDYPLFGDLMPRGTADFYVNFGRAPQPGCEEVDLLAANSCSHNRAVLFYAESIGLPRNFASIPCSWKAIRSSSSCLKGLAAFDLNSTAIELAIGNMDDGQVVYMGEQVTRSATSYYFLETNAAPPFGQGVHAKFD